MIYLLCFACHLYLHATREVVYYLTALNHLRCYADISDVTFKLPYIYDTPLARVQCSFQIGGSASASPPSVNELARLVV
jgi:hypothetical protein